MSFPTAPFPICYRRNKTGSGRAGYFIGNLLSEQLEQISIGFNLSPNSKPFFNVFKADQITAFSSPLHSSAVKVRVSEVISGLLKP